MVTLGKLSKHIGIAAIVVAVLLASLQFILPVERVNAAPPLNDADKQACYETLDKKTLLAKIITIPNSQTLYQSTDGSILALSNSQIQACIDSTTCNTTNQFIGINEYKVSFACAYSPVNQKKALDIEVAPIVKAQCGSVPTGENAQGAYLACATKVRAAFTSCRETGGSAVSSVRDSPSNIANCIIAKTKPMQWNANLLPTIVRDGQTAADAYRTQVAVDLTIQDCELRKDEGYVWNDQENSCEPPENLYADNCPLPADASMRWLGCAVFSALKGVADSMAGAIDAFLYTDQRKIFDNPATQKAASSFRNIAMALIIIAGLVMVIGQASGLELFDAYTIRKLLPRLGIALIGTVIAWPLLRFAVVLSNDLGGMINSLLMEVTSKAGATGGVAGGGSDLVTMLGIIMVGGGVFIALGVLGALSLLGTVVLALLIGLLVLSMRQLVIFMAVIIAPLAIASYVLPGTQKLWAFWKNTFITTLLMYFIIMGFIAGGKAMSYLIMGGANVSATQSGGGFSGDANMSLLAIIVYFAPFFLLPFAFKLAGGLMSTIFSLANDKNRGVFDRLKKGRGEIMQKRKHLADEGHLFDENNAFIRATGLNKAANMWGDPKNSFAHTARRIPGFRRAGESTGARVEAKRLDHSKKAVEQFNASGANAEFWRAISGSYDLDQSLGGFSEPVRNALKARFKGDRPKTMKDFQDAADILNAHGSTPNERIGGQILSSQAGRLATLYQDPEIGKSSVLSASLMGMASHGYIDGEDLASVSNRLTAEGMDDGAAVAVINQAQNIGSQYRPDIRPGYGIGIQRDPKTKKVTFVDGMSIDERGDALIKSMKSMDWSAAKPQSIEKLRPLIERQLNSEDANVRKAMEDQLFGIGSKYGSSSQEVKEKILTLMDNFGVPNENGISELRQRFNDSEQMALSDAQRGGRGDAKQPDQTPPQPGAAPH